MRSEAEETVAGYDEVVDKADLEDPAGRGQRLGEGLVARTGPGVAARMIMRHDQSASREIDGPQHDFARFDGTGIHPAATHLLAGYHAMSAVKKYAIQRFVAFTADQMLQEGGERLAGDRLLGIGDRRERDAQMALPDGVQQRRRADVATDRGHGPPIATGYHVRQRPIFGQKRARPALSVAAVYRRQKVMKDGSLP